MDYVNDEDLLRLDRAMRVVDAHRNLMTVAQWTDNLLHRLQNEADEELDALLKAHIIPAVPGLTKVEEAREVMKGILLFGKAALELYAGANIQKLKRYE